MGPKSKGSRPKSDWSFCSQTGIGFHASDSAAHSSLLGNSTDSFDEADIGFPHIVDSTFRSPVTVAEPKCGPALSHAERFHAVFLPSFVVQSCQIGFSSWVTVSQAGAELVLRAYPVNKPETNKVLCYPGSWLSRFCDKDQMVQVAPFNGQVKNVDRLTLRTRPELTDIERGEFLTKVKSFLRGKILSDDNSVLYNYFGKEFTLDLIRRGSEDDGDQSVCDGLTNLSISSCVSSTPAKETLRKPVYYSLSGSTQVSLTSEGAGQPERVPAVGGLDKQRQLLMDSVSAILSSENSKCVNGALLYGPPGVGKTLLALALKQNFKSTFRLVAGPELYSRFYGETETKIRQVFEDCERSAPSILVLDELDSLAPKKEGEGGDQEKRVISTIQSCLDRININQSRVAVIATTNKLDAVAPSLRRPGRFDLEIELGVPDVVGRYEILKIFLADEVHHLGDDDIRMISQETHGFVGADLNALHGTARLAADERGEPLSLRDFRHARSQVKPSAMREVQVEVPAVSWADIGGLDDLKLKLNQAVDWPIKHPEVFRRMGIKPPRGVLMYGPPGCSKTMIAKALANESGLNFLSIKGPELFSKWVGESEKAVRDLFRRARAVAPSIVFFDEIDALGASRGGGSSRVGERVLAQLLTEMDGVESLVDVTVLAATNRPDMMDRALLRPGRLDRVVYVPLPDTETRRKVLEIHTARMPVTNVDLDRLAAATDGYSGAELAAICNEAALASLEEDSDSTSVTDRHFEKAVSLVKPRIQEDLLRIYQEFQREQDKK